MSRIERTSIILLLAAALGRVAAAAGPTVTITEPAPGARVSGVAQIRAVASAEDPIDRVEFWVLTTYLPPPQRPVCTDFAPPYECSWRTPNAGNGRAAVVVRAVLGDGRRGAAEVDVMVVNPPVGDLRLTIPNDMQSYRKPRVWGPTLVYHDKFYFHEPYTGGNKILDLDTLVERDTGIGWVFPDAAFNNVVPFGVNAVYSEEYPPGPVKNLILHNAVTHDETILLPGPQVGVGDLDFFGERVVWSDQRDGNIHAIDVVTGEQRDLGPGRGPAIWGDTAIWSSVLEGRTFIQSYDFSTNQLRRLAEVSGGDGVLGISGQWVVWTGADPDQPYAREALHLLNVFSGARRMVAPPNRQRSPAIWGGKIVWTETRAGNQDVYLFDMETGKETRITTDPAPQSSPDVFGDLVVWHDARHPGSHSDVQTIYTKDLKDRAARPQPLGYLEEIDRWGIARGWAVDPASPEATVRLAFYDGPIGSGRFLGEARADLPRPDVNRMTAYPGDHGFEFVLPAAFQPDALYHSLHVYVLEDTSPGVDDPLLLDGCPMLYRFDVS